ncbi:MAG: ABC transporter ATP-binding protein [Chloroflexota bacterium]
MSARIDVRDVSVAYAAPDGHALHVLGPVSFALEAGQFVCLVGPSGCGKSTLIRLLAGLIAPTAGEASLDDQPIRQPSRRVALMFQDANLMPWRTVIDNIALPLELAGAAKAEREDAAQQLLPRLGLSEFALAYPGELSGGMAQRVALGRVLIQHPDVLLLDEPFGALDAMTREQVSADLLYLWGAERQTVLMVTHDINEAVLLSDRVLVMSRRPGQVKADLPVTLPRPRQLSDTYSDEFGKIAQQVRANIERI